MNPHDPVRMALATLIECHDNHAAAIELARKAINPSVKSDSEFEFRVAVHDILCGHGWFEC